jgi:hypothetical protein
LTRNLKREAEAKLSIDKTHLVTLPCCSTWFFLLGKTDYRSQVEWEAHFVQELREGKLFDLQEVEKQIPLGATCRNATCMKLNIEDS